MKLFQKRILFGEGAFVTISAIILSVLSATQENGIAFAFAPSSRNQQLTSRHQRSLLAVNGEDASQPAMGLLTDENRDVLLRPEVDPSRPILVDAFAPWCGPCKLLDKVLKKAQPRYVGKVDFCRWNVNDKENTAQIKAHFIDMGFTLSKLPSLIVYRDGVPIAVRPGFANEFQLDDWLETTLPDVLERTFDENGLKIDLEHASLEVGSNGLVVDTKADATENNGVADDSALNVERRAPSPMDVKAAVMEERLRIVRQLNFKATNTKLSDQEGDADSDEDEVPTKCNDEVKCWELLEETIGWSNRTVTAASAGLPLSLKVVA